MAASFRAYQNAVIGLPIINFVDESTGVTVTGRKIYLLLDNGDYLVPVGTTTSYIDWPTSSPSPFQVDVLDKDYSINISVLFEGTSNTSNVISESGNNLITEGGDNIVIE